ncbi:hypothetical protein RO3G_07900 [Rhizopus delemar RA 99-880]|uniref:Protein YTP1-like C-terminal domain-containing protein n=1 Tax=Rhizopus delemar (strain RA 99-880 / ATCC MYA-4621 / FGSC 9543 / NRRL 43880) TaxID=246409 RepID=I1C415_RHIO9|nr:hypothetical protein RO3G_07900 [Rhizopus delemar RA 99-880]|eukprot:EIE83195.1 hypothetical protein RO3G_07900 [Rhizopus delemar RA 99-880]
MQFILGVYLKLHLERSFHGRVRPVLVKIHKILGASIPVIGYVQIMLGVIASLGFCYGGGPWLMRKGRSQEWYDSWVIMLWGIVNTFTEHSRWGQPWNHGDYQHTSMGIIWWAAGLVGIMLSRNGKRTVVPSVLIILTAVAFQGHAQHVANSGAIHSYFGYMLMAGGLSRIVEICFVWKEGQFDVISPWQYLPPLTLILAGLLFMGSTEEQLGYLLVMDVDVSSYMNVLLSFGFVVFLFAFCLIYLWEKLTDYPNTPNNEGYTEVDSENTILDASSAFLDDEDDDAVELKQTNRTQ